MLLVGGEVDREDRGIVGAGPREGDYLAAGKPRWQLVATESFGERLRCSRAVQALQVNDVAPGSVRLERDGRAVGGAGWIVRFTGREQVEILAGRTDREETAVGRVIRREDDSSGGQGRPGRRGRRARRWAGRE